MIGPCATRLQVRAGQISRTVENFLRIARTRWPEYRKCAEVPEGWWVPHCTVEKGARLWNPLDPLWFPHSKSFPTPLWGCLRGVPRNA
jgi:hypothetical protein